MSRLIQVSLFLTLLHLTATAGQSSVIVQDGDEVALPCGNVRKDPNRCDRVSWISTTFPEGSVELVSFGQISKKVRANKSERLSVTPNCSLVIKKVTDEDAGRYTCREFEYGIHRDTGVILFTVSMTEHKNKDQVVWSCSVPTYGRCAHTVKWLYDGNDVDKDHKYLQTSRSVCSASVTFQSSHFILTSTSNLLRCEVTDGDKEQHLFPFRLQPSGEKPGDAATTMVATTTTATPTTAATPQEARADCSVLDYVMLVMRVAELLLVTVITVLLIRARGNQRPPEDNTVSNSARRQRATRSGAADSQARHDGDRLGGTVTYENVGDPSVSV